MKNILIFLLLGILANTTYAQEKSEQYEQSVIKDLIMNYYHEGHVKSDAKYYQDLFHDEWKMFSIGDDGNLFQVDKKTYLSWNDPAKADKSLKWKTDIHYIDVYGHLASVKVTIQNQNYGYIDYFNMMKINNKWWIVHKISRKK